MVEVNEYFDGKVKSFNVRSGEGKKTVGVMEPGEYEFNTKTKETMTVLSGVVAVYLAEYKEWEEFGAGSSFDVPAGTTFKVKVKEDAAYLCAYDA